MLQHWLSHHKPDEYYRCYRLTIVDRELFLCARCIGIYLGIASGFIAFRLVNELDWVIGLTFTPLSLTIFDWAYSRTITANGSNFLRTLSGFGIGVSFIWAWLFAITDHNWHLVLISYLIYSVVFLVLLKGALKNEQSN